MRPEAVRIDSNPAPEAWDGYVRDHPEASLFHGRSWQRALERSFRAYRRVTTWRGQKHHGRSERAEWRPSISYDARFDV